jgi:hypothetical protein
MQKFYLLFLVLLISGISCKKDNDNFVTGTVQVKRGCFSDSWLIAIDNPDPSKHSFLRTTTFASATFYNCSNAVFIDLPSSLAITGTRIRFSHIDTQPFSCLSYSEAPNHITVKNLSRL